MAFCDWLGIYQLHTAGGLPIINNGCIAQFEQDAIKQFIDPETGEYKMSFDAQMIEWTTQKHFDYEGSYSTKIRIKCDGFRITFDGNVSRFGRSDNVFGFGVVECVMRANRILALLGLPPFTNSRSIHTKGDGLILSGAVITRVDLTTNYFTGKHENAVRLIHYFGGQDSGRRASAKTYADSGVTWNEGSKFWYAKMYLKANSLGDDVTDDVKKWVTESGIVRHEISLKSRYLMQHGLRNINAWQSLNATEMYIGENMENIIYGRFTDVITRGTAIRSPLEDIPKNIGRIARDWRQGIDVYHDVSYGQSTRRRWRKELLAYGIDIKQTSNITTLPIRLEVINLQAVQAPDWYWSQEKLRVA